MIAPRDHFEAGIGAIVKSQASEANFVATCYHRSLAGGDEQTDLSFELSYVTNAAWFPL